MPSLMNLEWVVNMINIVQVIEEKIASKIQVYPQHQNRASSAGHPCERHLVYARLNWQERLKTDVGLQLIFNDGNMHEKDVLQTLRDAGFEVIESQRTFSWDNIQTTGRIDGMIVIDGVKYPLEVKSMNQYTWEKIKTAEDLRNSFTYYVKGYFDQMQLYLLMAEKSQGVILLKNKANGRLKQINVDLDYEYAEKLIKKLERVNEAVAVKTYPDRVADRAPCGSCAFKHICLPDEVSDAVTLNDNAELLELLERREQLVPLSKEYEVIDAKIKKDYFGASEDGVHLVGGKFQVKISSYERTNYDFPPELKEKYALKVPATRVIITALK